MIDYFDWTIRQDKKWYNDLVEKALTESRNIDEIIHKNAVWVFNTNDLKK